MARKCEKLTFNLQTQTTCILCGVWRQGRSCSPTFLNSSPSTTHEKKKKRFFSLFSIRTMSTLPVSSVQAQNPSLSSATHVARAIALANQHLRPLVQTVHASHKARPNLKSQPTLGRSEPVAWTTLPKTASAFLPSHQTQQNRRRSRHDQESKAD
jgi:hypothetical protein